jgi:hypothetical protein
MKLFGSGRDDKVDLPERKLGESSGPCGGWGEEAEDDAAFGESVEVAGLDNDAAGEGGVSEGDVVYGARDAEDDGPSALEEEALRGGVD